MPWFGIKEPFKLAFKNPSSVSEAAEQSQLYPRTDVRNDLIIN